MCQVDNEEPFINKKQLVCYKIFDNEESGVIRSYFRTNFHWEINQVYKSKAIKELKDIPHYVQGIDWGFFHSFPTLEAARKFNDGLFNGEIRKVIIPAGSVVIKGFTEPPYMVSSIVSNQLIVTNKVYKNKEIV